MFCTLIIPNRLAFLILNILISVIPHGEECACFSVYILNLIRCEMATLTLTTSTCLNPRNEARRVSVLSEPRMLRNIAFRSQQQQQQQLPKKQISWSISAQASPFDLSPPPIDHDFLVCSQKILFLISFFPDN